MAGELEQQTNRLVNGWMDGWIDGCGIESDTGKANTGQMHVQR